MQDHVVGVDGTVARELDGDRHDRSVRNGEEDHVGLSHGTRAVAPVESKGWRDRVHGSREQKDLATALLKGEREPLPHPPRPQYRYPLTRHTIAPLGCCVYQRARPPLG